MIKPEDIKHNIIAISGKARHGKDTLANLIIKNFNMMFDEYRANVDDYTVPTLVYGKKIAFADPIKSAARTIFPQLSAEDLWGPSELRSKTINNYINPKTKDPLTIRDILLALGSWGRSTNPDCWVNSTMSLAKDILRIYGLVVVADLRFENEAKSIKEHGGKIVKIIRNKTTYSINDESETSLDNYKDFDMYVSNDGNIEDLNNSAKRIVEQLVFDIYTYKKT